MKRFSLIQLHRQGDVSIIYDFATKHYYRSYESNTSSDGFAWFLVQPLAIYVLETIGACIDAIPGQLRFCYGMLAFIVCVAICALSVEAFLYKSGRKVIENSKRIPRPSRAELAQWANDYPRRIRNLRYILGALSTVATGLVVLFYFFGASIFLTLALAIFCIWYLIWGATKPNLLRRFTKTI